MNAGYRLWRRMWSGAAAFVLSGCGEGGSGGCAPSEASCSSGGAVSYTVYLDAAPSNLGALLVSIETSSNASVAVLSGRGMPSTVDGQGERRAIIVGMTPTGAIARITFASQPDRTPVVSVVQAATTQAGGYSPIARSNIRLRVDGGLGSSR